MNRLFHFVIDMMNRIEWDGDTDRRYRFTRPTKTRMVKVLYDLTAATGTRRR